jgi:BON domain
MSPASRRSLRLPIAVAVAGLTALGLGQGIVNRHSVEDSLTTASRSALLAAGVDVIRLSFTGRDATVAAATAADAERARTVLLGVDGVRVVTITASPATAVPSDPVTAVPSVPATPVPSVPEVTQPASDGFAPALPIGLRFKDGTLTITGTVPSDPARDDVLAAARKASFDWKVVDAMTIDPALRNVDPDWFGALTDLIDSVPSDGAELVARFEDDSVILRGAPATPALEKQILAAAAGTVSASGTVRDGLDPPAPKK